MLVRVGMATPSALPRRTLHQIRRHRTHLSLFTQEMDTWWLLGSYSRAVSEFTGEGVEVERLEFHIRMGGSILEHMSDGRTVLWGKVIAWDPPHRVVMAWRPHSMPEPPTDLETDVHRTRRQELRSSPWLFTEALRPVQPPLAPG